MNMPMHTDYVVKKKKKNDLQSSPWFSFRLSQAKRQQRKLNFLITQTELYAHFMSGKANVGGAGGDTAQEEILRKLEENAAQRQINIGGGVMVNMVREDYGMTLLD